VTIAELIVSHNGNPLVLNDPGSVEAFTFLQRLWRERLISRRSITAQWDTEVDNLIGKESSLAENWSFTSAQLAKLGELRNFQVYPGWRGPAEAHVIGGDVLGIPTGVKGRQLLAAESLANFLMSREAQTVLVMRNSWPSFRNDIDYDSTVPDEQRSTFAAIKAALEHGWYRPFVSYWPDVTTALNEAVTDILLHDDDVQPVLDRLHERVREAAAKAGAS
jgi:trehalose transport system substrate-binding protein